MPTLISINLLWSQTKSDHTMYFFHIYSRMTIYLFAGRREYPAHPGVYRKRLVTTSLTPENILQYTHQSKAPPKMILFVGMIRVIGLPLFFIAPEVNTSRRRTSLHLQWPSRFMLCFGYIHPFTVSVLWLCPKIYRKRLQYGNDLVSHRAGYVPFHQCPCT